LRPDTAKASEAPEIAEGQALLAALAETDDVKAAIASRKRRLRLHMQYRGALAWSRGAAADETSAAAARAERLVAEVNDPAARLDVHELQFLPNLLGGRLESAGSIAETYLSEARKAGALRDIAAAGMMLAQVRMYQGAFANARAHLLEALDVYDHGVGIEIDFAQELDWGTLGTTLLALVGSLARQATEMSRYPVAQEIMPGRIDFFEPLTSAVQRSCSQISPDSQRFPALWMLSRFMRWSVASPLWSTASSMAMAARSIST
jgi:hypothetical protein